MKKKFGIMKLDFTEKKLEIHKSRIYFFILLLLKIVTWNYTVSRYD